MNQPSTSIVRPSDGVLSTVHTGLIARLLNRRLDLLSIAFLFGLSLLLSIRQIVLGGVPLEYG
ncbi:MAG TPA: hypothetical protein VHS06_07260 [Chloroflexota bacterium]|nr:hypothetical protein [Chloroflexota bacterium]